VTLILKNKDGKPRNPMNLIPRARIFSRHIPVLRSRGLDPRSSRLPWSVVVGPRDQ